MSVRPDTLHLGCGENIIPTAHNVDKLQHPGVDQIVDLSEYPWPWDADRWDYIVAEHIFEHLPNMERTLRECARILQPGGRLEVALPVGQDSWADPDHCHRWTYDTPEMWCGARPWDVDVGLSVVDREVELWPHAPGNMEYLYGGVMKALTQLYPAGRWCFDLPATSGEFRVIFKK